MFINCDLVESIEATPDTIITMVDGRRMVVSDSPEDVIENIREHRSAVIAGAEAFRTGTRAQLFLLDSAVPDDPPQEQTRT